MPAAGEALTATSQDNFGFHVPWTCYYIHIGWHKHYVNGCISRDAWHLNFLVNNSCNGKLLFDAHLCSWWENGPQFGIYVTPSKWCRTTRGGYTAVRDHIRNALVAAGIGYAISVVIAEATAPVVVAALAL